MAGAKLIEEKKNILENAVAEYKILQDKIDKIGAFRFTIKGWSLTLIVASLFAGKAARLTPHILIVALLWVFLGIFFLIEKKQTDLSRTFGRRSRQIETVISGMLSRTSNGSRIEEMYALRWSPGVAHYLKEANPGLVFRIVSVVNRFARKRKWDAVSEFFKSETWRNIKNFLDADLWFYFIQAVIVVLTVCWLASSDPESGRSNFSVSVDNHAVQLQSTIESIQKGSSCPRISPKSNGKTKAQQNQNNVTQTPCR